MTISLKHAFNSAKSDGPDTTQVQPSNWNAEHVITMANNRLLGRTTSGGGGAVEEISVAASLSLSAGVLALATNPTVGGDLAVTGTLIVTGASQLTGGLGIGGAADAKAVLDIQSTTKGVLFPRMTATQRDAIATPPTGLTIYNTTANELQVYHTGAWRAVGINIGVGGAQASDATLTSLSGLSLSQGDILYATAADTLARLAKGTAGQVLKMNSGATAPEWGAPGDRVLLATKTASASANLVFPEFNNAVYRLYEFEFENVKPATDGVFFFLRTSTDGGSVYDSSAGDYRWGMNGTASGSTRGDLSDSATQILLTDSGLLVGNAGAEYGVSGRITVMNAPLTMPTEVNGFISYWRDNGDFCRYAVGGCRIAATDVDAVRFAFSSGNIATGTIRMYGVAP